jgi:uncharacterized membrane protein YidH (DUF202 family)
MDIETRLRILGQARREIGIRAQRRRQVRQVLNLLGYLAIPSVVTIILLSL